VDDHPFDSLLGHELDTVSFVRDDVELRIDYSIVRLLTLPFGSIDGDDWRLTDTQGADALRRYIGLTVVSTDFVEDDRLRLEFDGGGSIAASLREADRVGAEALHFVPALPNGGSTSPACGSGSADLPFGAWTRA
jgi:hypothetical protein